MDEYQCCSTHVVGKYYTMEQGNTIQCCREILYNVVGKYYTMLQGNNTQCCREILYNVVGKYYTMLQGDTLQCCREIIHNVVRKYYTMLQGNTIQCCREILYNVVGKYYTMLQGNTIQYCGVPQQVYCYSEQWRRIGKLVKLIVLLLSSVKEIYMNEYSVRSRHRNRLTVCKDRQLTSLYIRLRVQVAAINHAYHCKRGVLVCDRVVYCSIASHKGGQKLIDRFLVFVLLIVCYQLRLINSQHCARASTLVNYMQC